MSADVVIRAEALGKKYLINHSETREPYTALRDVIARTACQFGREVVDLACGRTPIGKQVEEFWALRDLSFEVKRGEVIGIIGRNGAGKSTLLKILSRITEPSAGQVGIKGRVASLLEVGTGFHPELTGRENISLNGAILGMRHAEIKRKFDEIVAFAEIEKFLDTPVKRYSSGMYVRLAFAVAAHLDPEILVVDEVLAVGDTEFQKKCLGKMRDVAGHGRTVMFVSHNMAAISHLCGRALVLQKGRPLFDGIPAQAIEAYVSPFSGESSQASWRRSDATPAAPMVFSRITLKLLGQQPRLMLECDVILECSLDTPQSFIAVDIFDHAGTPIMQALPRTTPFINGITGLHRMKIEIELPPLVPGLYTTDFWVGSHFSETVDMVRQACSFEVTDSPTVGRTFPHTHDHGFIVPESRVSYASADTFSSDVAQRF